MSSGKKFDFRNIPRLLKDEKTGSYFLAPEKGSQRCLADSSDSQKKSASDRKGNGRIGSSTSKNGNVQAYKAQKVDRGFRRELFQAPETPLRKMYLKPLNFGKTDASRKVEDVRSLQPLQENKFTQTDTSSTPKIQENKGPQVSISPTPEVFVEEVSPAPSCEDSVADFIQFENMFASPMVRTPMSSVSNMMKFAMINSVKKHVPPISQTKLIERLKGMITEEKNKFNDDMKKIKEIVTDVNNRHESNVQKMLSMLENVQNCETNGDCSECPKKENSEIKRRSIRLHQKYQIGTRSDALMTPRTEKSLTVLSLKVQEQSMMLEDTPIHH